MKPDPSDCLSPLPDGFQLAVWVQPRASRDEVGAPIEGALKIRVTAPPVDAAANRAVLALLARTLDCPKNALTLRRGQTSRRKWIGIRGVAEKEIRTRLGLGSLDGEPSQGQAP